MTWTLKWWMPSKRSVMSFKMDWLQQTQFLRQSMMPRTRLWKASQAFHTVVQLILKVNCSLHLVWMVTQCKFQWLQLLNWDPKELKPLLDSSRATPDGLKKTRLPSFIKSTNLRRSTMITSILWWISAKWLLEFLKPTKSTSTKWSTWQFLNLGTTRSIRKCYSQKHSVMNTTAWKIHTPRSIKLKGLCKDFQKVCNNKSLSCKQQEHRCSQNSRTKCVENKPTRSSRRSKLINWKNQFREHWTLSSNILIPSSQTLFWMMWISNAMPKRLLLLLRWARNAKRKEAGSEKARNVGVFK